jgi:hypothetical protein
MSNKQAQAEAWVRKKPKRTTHNQLLIQFLIVVAIGAPIALGGLAIAFAFCMPFMPLYILITWGIASVTYIALYIKYNHPFKRKE